MNPRASATHPWIHASQDTVGQGPGLGKDIPPSLAMAQRSLPAAAPALQVDSGNRQKFWLLPSVSRWTCDFCVDPGGSWGENPHARESPSSLPAQPGTRLLWCRVEWPGRTAETCPGAGEAPAEPLRSAETRAALQHSQAAAASSAQQTAPVCVRAGLEVISAPSGRQPTGRTEDTRVPGCPSRTQT